MKSIALALAVALLATVAVLSVPSEAQARLFWRP